MKTLPITLHAVSMFLLTSCITVSMSYMGPTSKADPERGYVYGNFLIVDGAANLNLYLETVSLKNPKQWSGWTGSVDFDYRAQLTGRKVEPLKVLSLLPGEYRIVYLRGRMGNYAGKFDLKHPEYSKTFTVEKGMCYYLGDFDAFVGGYRFGLRDIRDNYAETTKTLKAQYPAIGSLPTAKVFAFSSLRVKKMPPQRGSTATVR